MPSVLERRLVAAACLPLALAVPLSGCGASASDAPTAGAGGAVASSAATATGADVASSSGGTGGFGGADGAGGVGGEAMVASSAASGGADPSCGALGGNTCTSSATTLCQGLPLLASSDCEVCCQRPPDPPLVPSSFQIVHKDFVTSWDSILPLAKANAYVLIASQNKPDSVTHAEWAQNITSEYGVDEGNVVPFASGEAMADFIHAQFQKGATAPRRIMIDELRSNTKDRIHACALAMATKYPQWRGRWGAYLVHGANVAYPGLNTAPTPAIDALLDAGATLSAEMYPARSQYCAAGDTTAQRDAWLGEFFRGSQGAFPQGRFHWLSERKVAKKSDSQLTLLFGVIDTYMTGEGPAVFLDRMFYVWRAKSGYPSVLLPGGGGVGAYKWHDQSPSSRDLAFAQSFEHYVVQGQTTSLKGQVSCP
ncbi:MAG: hypothetical protein FJ096_12240 [Deltaproteobacteria bacterium]|nr:hypothetical protein [Deltaproteobacteria bacterium]